MGKEQFKHGGDSNPFDEDVQPKNGFDNEQETGQTPRRYTDPFEGKLGQRIIEEKLKKYERDMKKTRRDVREIASELSDNYNLDDEQAQSIAELINSMSNHTHNYSDLEGKPKLAAVATSGSYKDLEDTPVIPDVSGKVDADSLAAVATSGSYNDLEDKPVIPDVSGKVDADSLADVATSGSYNDLGDKPSIPIEKIHTVTDEEFDTGLIAPGHLYYIKDLQELRLAGIGGNFTIPLTSYSTAQ